MKNNVIWQNDRESMDKRLNCGRKSLIDTKGDRRLIRTVGKNRKQILSEIVENFNKHASQKLSLIIIQWGLNSYEIIRLKLRKTRRISKINSNLKSSSRYKLGWSRD